MPFLQLSPAPVSLPLGSRAVDGLATPVNIFRFMHYLAAQFCFGVLCGFLFTILISVSLLALLFLAGWAGILGDLQIPPSWTPLNARSSLFIVLPVLEKMVLLNAILLDLS